MRKMLVFVLLLIFVLCACQAQEIEVTRVKIMERRVIERVIVTVEVTRIERVVETPRPALTTPTASTEPELNASPSPPSPTATARPTPTPSGSAPVATATVASSSKVLGEQLLGVIQEQEQTLLSLVAALNSNPLPNGRIIELYSAIQAAPTFEIPDNAVELSAAYDRYRGQIDYVLAQGSDLYNHVVQIEAGEASNTLVDPMHLSIAEESASAGTSALQALERDLEALLASLP